jgi:hypothetical protein
MQSKDPNKLLKVVVEDGVIHAGINILEVIGND